MSSSVANLRCLYIWIFTVYMIMPYIIYTLTIWKLEYIGNKGCALANSIWNKIKQFWKQSMKKKETNGSASLSVSSWLRAGISHLIYNPSFILTWILETKESNIVKDSTDLYGAWVKTSPWRLQVLENARMKPRPTQGACGYVCNCGKWTNIPGTPQNVIIATKCNTNAKCQ